MKHQNKILYNKYLTNIQNHSTLMQCSIIVNLHSDLGYSQRSACPFAVPFIFSYFFSNPSLTQTSNAYFISCFFYCETLDNSFWDSARCTWHSHWKRCLKPENKVLVETTLLNTIISHCIVSHLLNIIFRFTQSASSSSVVCAVRMQCIFRSLHSESAHSGPRPRSKKDRRSKTKWLR